MYDMRDRTLQEQALGAIHGHTQNTVEPTAGPLDAIARFQRTDNRFFSSNALQSFAAGGPPPQLPMGRSPSEFLCIFHPAFFANMFKTPQLHGVRHTAPYFHDNSAKTLEDVMEHYRFFFTANGGFPITDSNILLTDQDIEDIIAFLKIL